MLVEVVVVQASASEHLDAGARYLDVGDVHVEVEPILHCLGFWNALEAHPGGTPLGRPQVDELGWIAEPGVDLDG